MLVFSALSLQNKAVDFTLEDCPVYLTDNKIILAKHEGSSILRADTVVRKDTETGVSEGDCVFQKGMMSGIVVYNQGFRYQTSGGRLKYIEPDGDMRISKGRKYNICDAVRSSRRQPVALYYKERTFSIKALLQYEEPFIVIHPQDDYFKKVLSGEIRISTGIGNYCFGDLYKDGGRIVLHGLVPCVAKGTDFKKLSEISGGKEK